MTNSARDKLIVALDVESADRALDLFEDLRETVGMFKIGMQLFTAAGPDIIRRIINQGGRVFLDLKYHDIPNTVAAAGVEAARLGVSIFNVHAAGGAEMMKRTAEAVALVSDREGLKRPKIIGVTLLTSIDRQALDYIGINDELNLVVERFARSAAACGLDGVVASAREIEIIRRAVTKPFLVVTPGMRSSPEAGDDQRRTLTAGEALRAGADYIVVGRPVLNAKDPVKAARAILDEMNTAFQRAEA